MAAKCASCPFAEGGDRELANKVLERTMFQASQICHHPALHGKKQTHLCRGARDAQLVVLHRMGMLSEPTDEAFRATSERLGVI